MAGPRGFDTSLLDRHPAERRRGWERERRAVLEAAVTALEAACERYGLREAHPSATPTAPSWTRSAWSG